MGSASTIGLGGPVRVFRVHLEPRRLNAPVDGPREGLRGHIIVLNSFLSQFGHMSCCLQLHHFRDTCQFLVAQIHVK